MAASHLAARTPSAAQMAIKPLPAANGSSSWRQPSVIPKYTSQFKLPRFTEAKDVKVTQPQPQQPQLVPVPPNLPLPAKKDWVKINLWMNGLGSPIRTGREGPLDGCTQSHK